MDWHVPRVLLPMAVTLAAATALTPLVRRLAQQWGILAHPDAVRRFHRKPVPLCGGVAVYLAMLVGMAFACLFPGPRQSDFLHLSAALIPAAGLACLFGALDDCYNFRSRTKLFFQLLAALSIVAGGYAVKEVVLFGLHIELGWLGVPITIVWLIGCVNALNLIDGLDGLASLVGLSTATMLGIISISMGNDHVAVVAMILAAAIAGFMLFNLPPATIFLGDSGSTLIGLVIGVMGIQGALKSSATLAITAPAVLMTLPMFDVVMAIIRRKLSGRPLAMGDRAHIHHVLLGRGLGPWQVLCVVGAICLTTGSAAAAATIFRMDALAWIIATTLVVLLIRFRVFGHVEFDMLGAAMARAWVQFARFAARLQLIRRQHTRRQQSRRRSRPRTVNSEIPLRINRESVHPLHNNTRRKAA